MQCRGDGAGGGGVLSGGRGGGGSAGGKRGALPLGCTSARSASRPDTSCFSTDTSAALAFNAKISCCSPCMHALRYVAHTTLTRMTCVFE